MKKGVALPFLASCGCSQCICVSCRKSWLPLTSRHGLWHSCGAGGAAEGCVALRFPSHQVTKVSARGEVSDTRCQEAGAQPVPTDHSRNTAPGREQREGGEGGRRKTTCRHSLRQLAQSLEGTWLGTHWIRVLQHCQGKGKSSHC